MSKDEPLEDRKHWQYEIILLYVAGLRPRDVINLGYSSSAAYRWHAIYAKAKKRLQNHFRQRKSVPLS